MAIPHGICMDPTNGVSCGDLWRDREMAISHGIDMDRVSCHDLQRGQVMKVSDGIEIDLVSCRDLQTDHGMAISHGICMDPTKGVSCRDFSVVTSHHCRQAKSHRFSLVTSHHHSNP